MAKLVFGMNQSLDGYVDHMALPPPSPSLFRHFIAEAQGQVGSVYGRKVYEDMRYWDDDHAEYDWLGHAAARGQPSDEQRRYHGDHCVHSHAARGGMMA